MGAFSKYDLSQIMCNAKGTSTFDAEWVHSGHLSKPIWFIIVILRRRSLALGKTVIFVCTGKHLKVWWWYFLPAYITVNQFHLGDIHNMTHIYNYILSQHNLKPVKAIFISYQGISVVLTSKNLTCSKRINSQSNFTFLLSSQKKRKDYESKL